MRASSGRASAPRTALDDLAKMLQLLVPTSADGQDNSFFSYGELWVPSKKDGFGPDGSRTLEYMTLLPEHAQSAPLDSHRISRYREAASSVRLTKGEGIAGRAWLFQEYEWLVDCSTMPGVCCPLNGVADLAGLHAALAVPCFWREGGALFCVMVLYAGFPSEEPAAVVHAVLVEVMKRMSPWGIVVGHQKPPPASELTSPAVLAYLRSAPSTRTLADVRAFLQACPALPLLRKFAVAAEALAASAVLIEVPPGAVLYNAGDVGSGTAFVILDGRIMSDDGAEVGPVLLGPGSSFGESSLFCPLLPRISTTTSGEQTSLMCMELHSTVRAHLLSRSSARLPGTGAVTAGTAFRGGLASSRAQGSSSDLLSNLTLNVKTPPSPPSPVPASPADSWAAPEPGALASSAAVPRARAPARVAVKREEPVEREEEDEEEEDDEESESPAARPAAGGRESDAVAAAVAAAQAAMAAMAAQPQKPSKEIKIEFEKLRRCFALPLQQAAKELGVCATTLKRICRSYNIPRWPGRSVRRDEKQAARGRGRHAGLKGGSTSDGARSPRSLSPTAVSPAASPWRGGASAPSTARPSPLGGPMPAPAPPAPLAEAAPAGPPRVARRPAPLSLSSLGASVPAGPRSAGRGSPQPSPRFEPTMRRAASAQALSRMRGTLTPDQQPPPPAIPTRAKRSSSHASLQSLQEAPAAPLTPGAGLGSRRRTFHSSLDKLGPSDRLDLVEVKVEGRPGRGTPASEGGSLRSGTAVAGAAEMGIEPDAMQLSKLRRMGTPPAPPERHTPPPPPTAATAPPSPVAPPAPPPPPAPPALPALGGPWGLDSVAEDCSGPQAWEVAAEAGVWPPTGDDLSVRELWAMMQLDPTDEVEGMQAPPPTPAPAVGPPEKSGEAGGLPPLRIPGAWGDVMGSSSCVSWPTQTPKRSAARWRPRRRPARLTGRSTSSGDSPAAAARPPAAPAVLPPAVSGLAPKEGESPSAGERTLLQMVLVGKEITVKASLKRSDGALHYVRVRVPAATKVQELQAELARAFGSALVAPGSGLSLSFFGGDRPAPEHLSKGEPLTDDGRWYSHCAHALLHGRDLVHIHANPVPLSS